MENKSEELPESGLLKKNIILLCQLCERDFYVLVEYVDFEGLHWVMRQKKEKYIKQSRRRWRMWRRERWIYGC